MKIKTVEELLKDSLKDKWSINRGHLCYEDNNIRFLFDKIESGFMGFNKLVLVSDGRKIKISFFDKLRIHKSVKKRLKKTREDMREKAISSIRETKYKISGTLDLSRTLPTNRQININDFSDSIHQYQASKISGGFNTTSIDEINSSIKSDTIKNRVGGCNCKKSENTLNSNENNLSEFKKNVEIEKARIRKILRKNNN